MALEQLTKIESILKPKTNNMKYLLILIFVFPINLTAQNLNWEEISNSFNNLQYVKISIGINIQYINYTDAYNFDCLIFDNLYYQEFFGRQIISNSTEILQINRDSNEIVYQKNATNSVSEMVNIDSLINSFPNPVFIKNLDNDINVFKIESAENSEIDYMLMKYNQVKHQLLEMEIFYKDKTELFPTSVIVTYNYIPINRSDLPLKINDVLSFDNQRVELKSKYKSFKLIQLN